MKTLFNDNWYFAKTKKTTDDDWNHSYKPIHIPHDWLIYDTNNLYETSFGRYKKTYDFGEIKGKSIRLYFEGVYMNSTVYINEKEAFSWKYGYSSFEVDITDFLQNGENEISVLVRHEAPNTRWYSGAGIYRNIYLIETEKNYIETDGIYFSAVKTADKTWKCDLTTEIGGNLSNDLSLNVSMKSDEYSFETSSDKTDFSFILENVTDNLIWDINNPVLFDLKVDLLKSNEIIDSFSQKVGLREISFNPNDGFILNGRKVKINGVCLHHDLGCLGAAINKDAMKRQLKSMQEMGVNSVRTSHNMPAKEFMELCDEMGILVNSEAFDMWERSKTEFDYARFFTQWYEKDVKSWVRRDRNHPSLIMWSVGNEIYDTHLSDRGREVAALLHRAVREFDPRCNAPTTIGSNYMPWDGAQNAAKEVDLAGYNYGERLYNEHHEKYPDWCIYGSETTAGVKSRGVYHFPLDEAFLTHDDLQCSSLGNCRGGNSAETPQKIIAINRDTDFCAGMYIWTGSDYIGEPSPYSTKNSYYGSIDTAGLRKDSFYLYQSAWTSEPVLHLMPYWDFNDGQIIDIVCYTNLDEVELFLNDDTLGKKKPKEYTISWKAEYKKGTIKAVGYKDGKEILTETKTSFGDSKKIILSPDKTEIKADGESLVTVTISVVDENDVPVENARDRINVKVEGGRLIGLDNGDSTDYDQYKSASRRLFSGKLVAYIAAPIKASEIEVIATAIGLESAKTVIKATESSVRKGISISENIILGKEMNDVPIRKISLIKSGKDTVTAEIYPKNATYNDISWRIVNNAGIDINIAKVEIISDDKKTIKINKIADGEFRLRCSANNGKPQPETISELEYEITGLGQAILNPYEFNKGCLYNASISKMDAVSNGGVNIKPENNIVGFTKTDFGKYGTDSFTVKIINWHKDDPFKFRLWQNEPHKKGSHLIGEFTYRADFIWQTYIENSYKLSQTLTGVMDLYFEFDKTDMRIDFGGFIFSEKLKAYELIKAVDNDLIHGDTYKIEGELIKGIGNNVFIDFHDMDFTEGVSGLTIKGKTRHDNDSIHLHFSSVDGESVHEIIEFPYSDNNIEVEKELHGIKGKGTIKFSFLPGCDFDFESFQFLR